MTANTTVDRVLRLARTPTATAYAAAGRYAPEQLWRRYFKLARRAGFRDVRFVLSFDCDTADDIEVVGGVHERLVAMGAKPVYAVPGAFLRKGRAVYRKLADAGAEFMNHGNEEHTYYDTGLGEHRSCFFYDEIGHDVVRRDVLDGQRAVEEVVGTAPVGFRAPHFGTFQGPDDLRFLHGVLREAGCRYSSSTVPLHAIRRGPRFDDYGLTELPVTGTSSSPLDILDTWGFFMAPDRVRTPADYLAEAEQLAGRYAAAGVGVLNVYADPSHIHDRDEFFEAVRRWLEVATPVDLRTLVGARP